MVNINYPHRKWHCDEPEVRSIVVNRSLWSSKWIHKLGILQTGRLIWISLCLTRPSGSRTIARPASFNSRSNQLRQMPPPYNSAPSWTEPHLVLSDRFLTRRHGESVCATTSEKPFPGLNSPPTWNAANMDWFRVTKNLSPALIFQMLCWNIIRVRVWVSRAFSFYYLWFMGRVLQAGKWNFERG